MPAAFGAHGYFENYESLADVTKADLFQRAGEKTPAFVCFSTVAGNKGSADLARDVRGFAVKLYTQQGNWDIVGNNIPVFFIQDALKFPDFVHSVKRNRIAASPRRRQRMTTFGTLFRYRRRAPTRFCGLCRTGRFRVRCVSWKALAFILFAWWTPRVIRPS